MGGVFVKLKSIITKGIIWCMIAISICFTGNYSSATASTRNADYLISYSSNYKLSYADISGLSKYELSLARNEIYARHGYIFKTKQYKDYFSAKWWYKPNKYFSERWLSSTENYNIAFLLKAEKNYNSNNYYNSNYIIPDSSYRKLTYSELTYYTKAQLALARNEIYARHGYCFKEKQYRDYFNSKSWYYANPKFSQKWLSSIEQYNIALILKVEKSK